MFNNLITTLRRFKAASLLNIVGLSVSFAAFILIMIQVWTEFNAGTDDPRHGNIYRLEVKIPSSDKWYISIGTHVCQKFAEVMPQVKECALYTVESYNVIVGDTKYTDIPITYIGNDISKVMQYRMVEGLFDSALAPDCALIDHSTAKRLFADRPAMGQSVTIIDKKYVITGVYRDFPSNSMYVNGVVVQKSYGRCNAYFLLMDGADTEAMVEQFKKEYSGTEFIGKGDDCRLVALADTYFENQFVRSEYLKAGNRTTTLILLSIALLIIMIAVINFVNFSTSLAPMRIRSLNIREVFGSSRRVLRVGIVNEAFLFSLISYLIAIVLVMISSDTPLRNLFKASDLTIGSNLTVIICTGVFAIFIGAAAGVYPAFYCTRFKPAMVLKGSFGLSTSGRTLRTLLLSVQFVISIILITVSLFVHLQNSYLLNKNLGYDSEDVIVVRGVWDRNGKVAPERIKGLSAVKSSATFDGHFGQQHRSSKMVAGQDTVDVFRYEVEDGFLELMNIPIIQGRSLTPSDKALKIWDNDDGSEINILVTKSALKALNTAVDSVIRAPRGAYRVVGVTDDIIGNSLYAGSGVSIFLKSDYMNALVVRTDVADSGELIKQIRAIMDEIQPYGESEVDFFDTRVAALYQKERDVATLITIFSLLAIVISLMGVFGLVLFETQYRRKEIGLRKIHGASVNSVLMMFNDRFIRLVIVCFVVSAPISYYAVNEWLSSFPNRTPIYWWVFVVALMIVLSITTLTVSIQSRRAATENPVKSIKLD